MKKGDIYWGCRSDSHNSHLVHPIVIMQDVDVINMPDKIKAVILSSKAAKKSVIKNVQMSRYHFVQLNERKRFYKIRVNRKKQEYLVCCGFLKIPSSLRVHESGRLTTKGISFVEETLRAYNVNEFDYIPYTIKEYAKIKKIVKNKINS